MMRDLLSILGFLLAGFCFFVWYGGRNGAHTESMSGIERGAIPEEGTFNADVFSAKPLERPDEVTRSNSRMKIEDEPEKLAAVSGTSAHTTSRNFKREIQTLAEAAMSTAIEKQIPAGASLALLIYSAERGKQLTTSNLNRIVEYLLGVKYSADEKDKQAYFKYSSNSEKWFQGLGLDRNGGHPKADLLRIYKEYGLKSYDKDVYAFVINPETSRLKFDKKIEPKSAAPAMQGDFTDEEVRRNHAYAKNRWAETESRGTEAEVKFVPAKKYEKSAGNAIRNRVESLSIGESMTFDNPGEYHLAVKEMIALEAGFDSWDAYEIKIGKREADKYFRKRAEKGGIMATGTLKVTRER